MEIVKTFQIKIVSFTAVKSLYIVWACFHNGLAIDICTGRTKEIIVLFRLMLYVHGTQLRSCQDGQLYLPLGEEILMSTHNIVFYEEISKIISF